MITWIYAKKNALEETKYSIIGINRYKYTFYAEDLLTIAPFY
jgi:hypothetical protein